MRARCWLIAAAVGVAALVGAHAAQATTVQVVTSPGGITAWLVEDHSLPVVSLEASFIGGSAEDPKTKSGLAELTFDLLDEGAGDMDSTAFQRKVEDLATSLDFNVDRDTASVDLRTLSANLVPTLDLVRLALTAPRFADTAVARVRGQLVDELEEEAGDPESRADRIWWSAEFSGHPYGMPVRGTVSSVTAITPDDMRAFMRTRIARDAMLVGVVGDVTAAQLGPLLDKTFGGLPAHAAPSPMTAATLQSGGQTLLLTMKIPQSAIVFGQPGIHRDDKDWYAAYLVSHILAGNGLTSRLVRELREKRGLVYSVYADLDPLLHGGVILGAVATENAHVAESIDLIRAEWARMRDKGPTAAELAAAKIYLTGSFPLSFDSTLRIAGLLVLIQKEHLGVDYLDRRSALIDAVTLADAQRAAKRILDPAALSFAVVGSPGSLPGARTIAPGE